MLAENEVIGCRELLAVAAYGVLHLLTRVALVAQGEEIHNGLAIGSLHVAHTLLVQSREVVLRDAVLSILNEDIVSIAGTANKLTRYSDVGLDNRDTCLLLGACARTTQGIGHHLAVVNQTGNHTLGMLGNDSLHIHCATLGQRADSNDNLG